MALDYTSIAVAELGNIADRRCYLLLDGKRGLPKMLTSSGGLNSGMMIPQYVAAALVSENKHRAHAACVDSIPTSANMEDHVSMGWSAARKLRRSIDGLTRVLAIELMTSARGIQMRGETPAPVSAAVIDRLRVVVPGPGPDRYLAPDIAEAVTLVENGELLRASGLKGRNSR